MPNPNELERLQQERADLIYQLTNSGVTNHKSQKEKWLRELRAIEKQLGIGGRPYNSSAFGGDDGENGR